MRTFYLLASCFILLMNCKKETASTEKKETSKAGMNVVVNHKKPTALNQSSQNLLANWIEYKETQGFLTRFENISPNEALSNALELRDLSKRMKDTIRVEMLQKSSFKARLNVFENEVLRLADMTYISAITSKEVNNQIDKIFLIFGSVNAKINATSSKNKLDKEIDLDNFFELDSTEKGKKKNTPQKVESKSTNPNKRKKIPSFLKNRKKKPVDKTVYQ